MVLLRTSYICTGTSSNTILDHPKIASTIMKKPQTPPPPLEKFSISQKTLTPSEKFSTSLK